MAGLHSLREYDLGEMAGVLAGAAVRFYARAQAGLELCAQVIEADAKAKFGHYQSQVGPHPAWAQLADSTKEKRLAAGYTENDPLLASGDMKSKTSHEVWGLEAVIGSTDEKMIFHELGTRNMPPRPVFGPAGFESKDMVRNILGNVLVSGVLNVDLGRTPGAEIGRPGYADTLIWRP